MKGKLFTADFETTTDLEDCRVWAYGICEIGNPTNFMYGNNLDDFMEICANKKENCTYFFHNLKFDVEFIYYWLERNGYKHVKNKKDFKTKTYMTLISDKGQFYSTQICFSKEGKKTNKVTFLDSLKILNFRVEKIAEDFGLSIKKLELDYKSKREIGHTLTQEEVDYLRNDVEIMARALEIMFDNEMDKMTIASSALNEYKNVIGESKFKKTFPSNKI